MNIAEINDHYFDTSALILDGCDGCFWALDLQTLGFFFFFTETCIANIYSGESLLLFCDFFFFFLAVILS